MALESFQLDCAGPLSSSPPDTYSFILRERFASAGTPTSPRMTNKRSKARSVSECRIECHPERAEVYAKDEKSTRSDSGAARDFHGPTIKVLASAASDS